MPFRRAACASVLVALACVLPLLTGCDRLRKTKGDAGADGGGGSAASSHSCPCAVDGQCTAKVVDLSTVIDPGDAKHGPVIDKKTSVVCIATSDADCRKSTNCKEQGACAVENERCVPKSVEDCRASSACKARGNCSLSVTCAVVSEADCKLADVCTKQGHCTFQSMGPGWGTCAAGSAADCKRAPLCKTEGLCSVVSPSSGGKICGATNADCKASPVCKSEGRCKADTTGFHGYRCIKG
ncbi:MAG: hypothetical protein IPQ09_22685 [Myxococcales bacterium]|nr:hypothetical protein [Myxococcales bacterium]HQY65171.1 hypothetical protein [Polyangiaceae bacterium]